MPILTKFLGHRRSWMIVTQAVVILGLWSIAGLNPATALGSVAVFAVLTGFFGATQDIVIDAWRIEAADDSRHGAMAAAYQWGYRIAIIVAGAVPLLLAEAYNWNLSYAVMAALMGVGVLGVLLAPREQAHNIRPIPVGDVPSRPAFETDRVDRPPDRHRHRRAGPRLGPDRERRPAGWRLEGAGPQPPKAAEALKTAWAAKPDGVWFQVACGDRRPGPAGPRLLADPRRQDAARRLSGRIVRRAAGRFL